ASLSYQSISTRLSNVKEYSNSPSGTCRHGSTNNKREEGVSVEIRPTGTYAVMSLGPPRRIQCPGGAAADGVVPVPDVLTRSIYKYLQPIKRPGLQFT
ncbi:hypothetical protein FRC14_001043, partial [Serendipita sp. 396]